MSFDTFLKIAFVVMGLIAYGMIRYSDKNAKVTYKDQRVGVRTKWWRR